MCIRDRLLTDLHPAFDPARYEKFLEFFALHGTDTIGQLSTGQRARVELAAGFAKRVPYYLMDEPFLGKDPFTRRDFIKLMSATLTGGETLLLSTCLLYTSSIAPRMPGWLPAACRWLTA